MIARLDSDRSRTLMLVAALTALALALDLWQGAARQSGVATWFDGAVCAISRPLQQGLTASADALERGWLSVVRAKEVVEENERLALRVAELERQLSEVEETRAAAERARRLLGARPSVASRKVARVIGHGHTGWSLYLTLDRGSADGLRQGDVAVTGEGVVGQVYAVTAGAARVIPLTEPASAISVRLQRSRESGILKGLGDWRCEIHYLDPEADVRSGDVIITSGLGGVFPPGLRVGRVVDVRQDRYSPGKLAEVRPAAHLRRVEEVLVVRAEPGPSGTAIGRSR